MPKVGEGYSFAAADKRNKTDRIILKVQGKKRFAVAIIQDLIFTKIRANIY
jgi:hypothetical protein